MRHYNVPRLDKISYYVVFCDCGKEIKRFYNRTAKTGKEQFEEWFSKTSPTDHYCSICFALLSIANSTDKVENSIENTFIEDTFIENLTATSPIQSFIDDLNSTYQTILLDIDPEKSSLDSKREIAKQLSHIAATACAALALQPIPIADVFVITPLQVLLVQAIGRVYGVPLSTKTALEVATNIGLGVILQQIFVAMVKVGIPLMGGLLVSTYVYTSTFYMGKIAQIYFEKGRPLTPQEVQQVQATRSRAEERLKEIDHLKTIGLITEEEYFNKRTKILDEI
ncbi:MAG: DUF697 domain-containing protein [Acidobacteria bacterium]|nr:DUF697 domain-containing protein [Acidobacteriota bacterium]